MKSLVLWLAMMATHVAWGADAFPFPEYEGPRAKYLEAIEQIRAPQKLKLAPLNATYAQRLESLVKTMVDSGDPSGVAAVRAEQARVKRGLEPSQAERNAMPGLLRVQRTSYEKERIMLAPDAKLEAPLDEAWKAEVEKLYFKLIHPLQTDRFAKQKAAIARAEMERLTAKANPPKPAPQIFPPVASITPGVPSKPAPLDPGLPAGALPAKTGLPAGALPAKTGGHPVAVGISTAETRKMAADLVAKMDLTVTAKTTEPLEPTEAAEAVSSAVSRDLRLLRDVKKITLLSVHDAAKAPMNRNSGELYKLRGSRAKEVVVGTNSGIMLWGPYDSLEAGSYIVVFRFKFREEAPNLKPCRLEVADEGTGLGSLTLKPTALTNNEWTEYGYPLELDRKRNRLEYRIWPNGSELGVDRIYIYHLKLVGQ